MASQSLKYQPLFSKIYTSRQIMLEILGEKRGFDISKYENEGSKELRSMWENKQLDILVENPQTNKKIYIKYHLEQKIKATHIYDYIEDIFEIENLLNPDDELIIVTKDNLNDTIKNLLQQINSNDNRFVNVYDINSYLFNILKHEMVPEHIVLNEEETEEIIKQYYVDDITKFPNISRFDPVALAIGLRPKQMVKIKRSSPTAIETLYYRICH
jgi:DNA-directed RNA polymerase subunit H